MGYATDLELARAFCHNGYKGAVPKWQERTWPRAEPRGPGSMQQRKLRRRVAQLHELRRHLQRPQRSQFQTSEANRLLQRLHLHGPLDQSGLLSDVLSELEQAKTTLLSTQKEARTTTLRAWAARMNEDPKAPGRWLQSREKVPVRAVQGRVLCENPRDITNEIFQFWTQFWTQNQTVDVSEICDRLQQSARQPAVHLDWAPPDLPVLIQVFRKSGGSGGRGWVHWSGT